MVITFLTMYNKNQSFYNAHGNYKNINLLAKNKYMKTLLTYNEKSEKRLSWNYTSGYSENVMQPQKNVFVHYN